MPIDPSVEKLLQEIEQYQSFTPIIQLQEQDTFLKFYVPNLSSARRVLTLRQKEPETLAWIDDFAPDDVLYDIGANVGIYSIYAALMSHSEVYAIEPESLSASVLNRNIFYNEISDRVHSCAFAFNDQLSFSELHLTEFAEAQSGHNFGEKKDYLGRDFAPRFSQGCLSIAIDDFVQLAGVKFPTHIKIDVDGIEEQVLLGGQKTLQDPRLQSLLVEIQAGEQATRIPPLLYEYGFTYDEAQVEESRANMQKHSDLEINGANYIFTRTA